MGQLQIIYLLLIILITSANNESEPEIIEIEPDSEK